MERELMFASNMTKRDKCERYFNKKKQLHRGGDMPAIDCETGEKMWFQNGKIHREGDKPAVIHSDGCKKWYKNGKFIKSEGGC